MSEYKRFVSYIYAYTKEGKGTNTGFAKVEIRAGKKRISITMRGVQNAPVMHVCGFCRREERLMCVPLGRMILTGGSGQFQYGMDGEWIPGSRVRFEELSGIVVSAPDSSGDTYATVWDDEPFQLSMFAWEEPEDSQNVTGAAKEPETPMAVQDPAQGEDAAEEKAGLPENGCPLMRENVSFVSSSSSVDKTAPADGASSEEDASASEHPSLAEDIALAGSPLPVDSASSADAASPMGGEEQTGTEYMGERESEFLHSAQLEDEGGQEKSGADAQFWSKMRRIYPQITPFSYENHMECLKVKPGDIGRLPRQNWIFGNNSFLLHGYFKYRYLIFGKVEEEDAGGYLIGVPGTYSNNEKFLAGMFGFYDFKPVQKGSVAPGAFGYWCTPMECPRDF